LEVCAIGTSDFKIFAATPCISVTAKIPVFFFVDFTYNEDVSRQTGTRPASNRFLLHEKVEIRTILHSPLSTVLTFNVVSVGFKNPITNLSYCC
jgi:hypothetical protein